MQMQNTSSFIVQPYVNSADTVLHLYFESWENLEVWAQF